MNKFQRREVREVPKSLVGGFAEILEVGEGEYPQFVGTTIWVAKVHSRAGPWFSVTGILLEDVPLNGTYLNKQGGYVWLRKAKLKPISYLFI